MLAVRRLYLCLVSAASLAMLVGGLAGVGTVLVELAGTRAAAGFGQAVAGPAALALVGLPVWALHWSLAQRLASRDVAERASALRRLYLYLVSAALSVALAFSSTEALQHFLAPLDSGLRGIDAIGLGRSLWQLALVALFWAYHFQVAAQDRAAVGERGASATLRRWYTYGVQLVALVIVLIGTRDLLQISAANLSSAGGILGRAGAPAAVALTLSWLGIWVFLLRWTERSPLHEDDRRSTLRAVGGFLVLALSVALVLADTSRVLYYGLARVLGVEAPGGVRQLDLATLADPLSTIVVFGAAWALVGRRLTRDAAEAEAPRQAGIRRLYTHLAAFLALGALAGGVGGLLWTLVDQVLAPGSAARPEAWRDQVSLFLTLTIVGLAVWLLHWRAAPAASERQALSRRLYLFGALLGGVLALLAAGAALVTVALNAVLTGQAEYLAGRVAQPLSAILVAVAVASYHWHVLRQDMAERAEAAAEAATARPTALVAEIVGATEAEVQEALAHLPPGARYSVQPQEPRDGAC